MSPFKSPAEEEPNRERRRDKRYSMPTLVVSIDGKLHLTKDWSLSGVLLTNYFGRRVEGNELEGKIGVITTPGKHPFKGITVRRDVDRGELALRFTELSDSTLALLRDASAGSP